MHAPLPRLSLALLMAMAASLWWPAAAHAGKTLEAVKARGQLVCGINTGLAGFAAFDSRGRWIGLDVDFCRALAATVLGDAEKVKFKSLNAQQRFTALQTGEVDVLARNTSFTLQRDAGLGLRMTAVTYYDGQGFLVTKKSGIRTPKDLNNQTVCVQSGTTTEKNLTDFARANGITVRPVVFEKFEAATSAYLAGRCNAYTTDASGLAVIRLKATRKPDDHVLLPQLISKEPLGPMVRRGDDDWAALVTWLVHGLVEAEERGITQANAEEKRKGSDPAVNRLLGTGDDLGKPLGLDALWLLRAIRAVGNYGELFDRNLGAKSGIGLERGLNKLWTQGGLMYALPPR